MNSIKKAACYALLLSIASALLRCIGCEPLPMADAQTMTVERICGAALYEHPQTAAAFRIQEVLPPQLPPAAPVPEREKLEFAAVVPAVIVGARSNCVHCDRWIKTELKPLVDAGYSVCVMRFDAGPVPRFLIQTKNKISKRDGYQTFEQLRAILQE